MSLITETYLEGLDAYTVRIRMHAKRGAPARGPRMAGGGPGGSTSGGCGDGTSGLDGMVGISGADVQHRAGSGGGRRHGLL